ncbi:Spermatogenesis-associated protein 5 [Chionoecetes opilio]|uniref:Spermatogenesis-associated protein 5 n=1 Tax=Chionoecetes opilio TaxID=41210 RepID=A0A8J5CPK9_CHIOP|nr:Spermatogenesis-associated protein 5 [Chionoecetes opilio]
MAECHELALKLFSHPFITEWLKKILPSLHYRVVLMNERDLIRCDITAYTPVELRVGDTAWGFLAMPEEGTPRFWAGGVVSCCMDRQSASRPVFLIAATSQPARVAPKLRSPGRLEREIMVPLPDAQQRGRIFQQLMSTHRHDLTEDDINSVAKKAYGFSGADLSVLIRCAWLACTKRTKEKEDLKLSRDDVYAGLQSIVPTMLRHNYSAVSMKNIELYTCNPEKHSLKGLLLYGPPGCSKTMFVRALVHETSYSFFPLKCSNLLSKYVGETEKLLSQVFVRAQQAAPSVVFMDEVDSLCGERTGGGSLVSELLSLMAQTAVQRNIMVIGATNRPHGVDEALLRPGYLEQVITDLVRTCAAFETCALRVSTGAI